MKSEDNTSKPKGLIILDYPVYNRRQMHKPELFSRSVSPLPANYAVAMMYVPMQTNTDMFDEMKALECGTLFPCLNKPFAGKCCK